MQLKKPQPKGAPAPSNAPKTQPGRKPPKHIRTPASEAKAAGGSGNAGSGIGNT